MTNEAPSLPHALIHWLAGANNVIKLLIAVLTVVSSVIASMLVTAGVSQVTGVEPPLAHIESRPPASPAYGEIPCPAGYELLQPPTGPAAIDAYGASTLTLCQAGTMRLRLTESLAGERAWVSFNLATGVEAPRPDLPVSR